MKWSLTRREWVALILLFALSFLFNQYLIDARFYNNSSNKLKDTIDIALFISFWFIGQWGLKEEKTWVINVWNILFIAFLILIITLIIIDWFFYSYSTKQGTLRLGSIKQLLANPITYLIFIFLDKYSKTITTPKR